MLLSKVKLHWYVDQYKDAPVNQELVTTRFVDEQAARRYAAAVGGAVRPPREALSPGSFGNKLFEALRS